MKLNVQIDPPLKIKRENYILEVLAPKHNERDYEAWFSSRESLKGIFGPRNDWPGEVTSLDYNLRDLENHLREFNEREAYTYSILSLDEKRCIGCLYIRPTVTDKYSARVDFWFRDDSKELEDEFYIWLKDWLIKFWKLENPCFPGRSLSWPEYYQLVE